MIEDVSSKLNISDKGQLQYGVTKEKHSLFVKENQSFVELEREVFDLKDIGLALEICEESAHDEELRHNAKKQAQRYMDCLQSQNDANVKRKEPIKVLNLDGDVESFVHYVHGVDDKIKEDFIDSKTKLFENVSYQLSQSAEQGYAQLREARRRKTIAEQERFRKYLQEGERTADQLRKQNIEQHKSRNRIMLTRIEEAENRRKLKIQQCRERLKNVEALMNKQKQLYAAVTAEINKEKNQLFTSNVEILGILREIESDYLAPINIFKQCQDRGGMEQVEQDKIIQLSRNLQQHVQKFFSLLEQLRLKEAEREKMRQEALRAEQQNAAQKLKVEQERKEKELATQNPESACPALPKELALSVSRAAYHNHLQLKTFLNQFEEKKKRFVSDRSNTKLIMAINKAISVPVSSITNRAGSDIKNKINDLNAVLKGENIKVNNQLVSLDDDARSYACLCMVQKFVKQAESQVSSNHSTAFCLALAVLGVWTKHATFGRLFLAQMQTKCPFVVPWYIPQLPNEPEMEYNKKRGYLYNDDGSVEKQDKYLGRMSGLVRTYAALIQSPLPPGVSVHPHGVAEGWKWLARMLNLDPWPDVTATVLLDFVEVCGHMLMTSYGKQFEKLLYALCHDYFPKIEEISEGGGGPLQRLQMFLKECVKVKNVQKPDGHLSESFWNTYHHTGVVGS